MNHTAVREGDEFACSCGLRWDTTEEDPHTETFGEFNHEEGLKTNPDKEVE